LYKLIIADDHEIVRCGIRFELEKYNIFEIKGEASNFVELLELLHKNSYDLLVLDLNMGDQNGISTIRKISDEFPSLMILVLSMFPEDPYAIKSIHAGASGYLNKKVLGEELKNAIDTILNGKVYLNPKYEDMLLYGTNLSKNSIRAIDTLSEREYLVYKMTTSGISNKEIAETLNLSPKTISTYRTRILEKLSLNNINQLIHYALQDDLGKSS